MASVLPTYESFDPAFGHWLAGFIAGEGCFSIPRYNRNGNHYCAFRLTLRDDDRPILEEIIDRVAVGALTDQPAQRTSKPQTSWAVQSKPDCLALVHLLDRFSLRAKKAKDYSIWRRAVFAWSSEGQARLASYRSALDEARAYRA